ncbi:MAG: hypothetical protein KTR29_01150 [Rhodothermaceae bacterium]|nr:hypothetical protein [Rhodothermaceae bacterium]
MNLRNKTALDFRMPILLLLSVFAFALTGCYTIVEQDTLSRGDKRPSYTPRPYTDNYQPRTFTGRVLENVKACYADASCYLLVEAHRNEVYRVFYGGGRGSRCTYRGSAGAIRPGERVKVFAKCKGSSCSVCGNDGNYYVSKSRGFYHR